MYIQQAFKSLHEWWRYVVGVILIIIASQIGTLPFVAAVFVKQYMDGGSIFALQDQSVLMGVLESNLTLFLMLLSFAIGLLGVYLVVKYLHQQLFKELTTSRKKVDWGRVYFSFGLIVVITVVLTVIDYQSNPENYIFQFQLVPFLILFVIAIVMIPLQTSFEEYLFRGYMMQGLGVLAKNKWVPLVVTSVIFGLLHMANPEVTKIGNIIMIYYIGTGFLLGIMTLMDEGMELALGFHAGNNLVGVLLVTADWTVFQTHSILKDIAEPSAGLDIILPVVVFYPLLLLIMAKKYKWTGWREKLFGRVEEPLELQQENINHFED